MKQRVQGSNALFSTGGRSNLNRFWWYRHPETCSTKMTSIDIQMFPQRRDRTCRIIMFTFIHSLYKPLRIRLHKAFRATRKPFLIATTPLLTHASASSSEQISRWFGTFIFQLSNVKVNGVQHIVAGIITSICVVGSTARKGDDRVFVRNIHCHGDLTVIEPHPYLELGLKEVLVRMIMQPQV